MRREAGVGVALAALVPLLASAQTVATPSGGACLTAEQKATNAAYYSLSRPTSRDDQMPFFDPEYFAGTWDFIARAVDSPLGGGGESAGTLTIAVKSGCTYAGDIKGEDPDGKPFTRTVSLTWDSAKKHLTWIERDSRGYTFDKSGVVGGELGGLFHHHYEDAPPITVGGHTVRITGVSEMSSPAFFKSDSRISTDGGPTLAFGRATFEKRLK